METMGNEDFWNDPQAAVRAEVQRVREAERNQERFWQEFYSENEHLKGREKLVDQTIVEHADALDKLPVQEGKRRLVELVASKLDAAGENGPAHGTNHAVEPDYENSLSALTRKRREALRQLPFRSRGER
jgi:hypothetical protein